MSFLKKPEKIFKNILIIVGKKLFSQPPIEPKFPINRILVIRPSGIGDMILSIPVLNSIRKNHPNSRIDVLCEPSNVGILQGIQFVDNIYIFKKNIFEILKLVVKLKKADYDYLLNINGYPSFTFGILGRIVVPKFVRASGDQRKYSYFFNRIIDLPPRDRHHMLERLVIQASDLLGNNNFNLESPWFNYDDEITRKAGKLYGELLKSLKIKSNFPKIILVNLSAGQSKREWTIEKFIEFLRISVEKYSDKIDGWVILTNPKEIKKSEGVVKNLNFEKVIAMPVEKDFRVIIALLKNISLVISPDTSIVHAASAMGTPVFDLILESNFFTWAPIGSKVKAITPNNNQDVNTIELKIMLNEFDSFLRKVLEN